MAVAVAIAGRPYMHTQPRAVAFLTGNGIQWCRAAVWVLIVALGLQGGFARAGSGGQSYAFDTTDQSLAQALKTYAQTTNQQIIFTEDLVEGVKSNPVKGELTARAALEGIL